MEFEDITKEIIGAAFEVHNELGYGFLEKVYQRAMAVELGLRGIEVELESALVVVYKDQSVGEYFADLLIEKKVIVELKVARTYNQHDEPQLLNELKATGLTVGLLVNFGREKVEFKRFVHTPKT